MADNKLRLPTVQAIRNTVAQLSQEILKFSNLPAIAHGDEMLAAIKALENRLAGIEERVSNLESQGASLSEMSEQFSILRVASPSQIPN